MQQCFQIENTFQEGKKDSLGKKRLVEKGGGMVTDQLHFGIPLRR